MCHDELDTIFGSCLVYVAQSDGLHSGVCSNVGPPDILEGKEGIHMPAAKKAAKPAAKKAPAKKAAAKKAPAKKK